MSWISSSCITIHSGQVELPRKLGVQYAIGEGRVATINTLVFIGVASIISHNFTYHCFHFSIGQSWFRIYAFIPSSTSVLILGDALWFRVAADLPRAL